jgi:voltage-dependent calcium channel L type alpha-1D
VPAVLNVIIVCLLFLLIFAIVGVNYFKGNFNRCSAVDQIYRDGGWWSEAQAALLVQPRPFASFAADGAAALAVLDSLLLTPACLAAYEAPALYLHAPPTSRWVCECSRLAHPLTGELPAFGPVVDQDFNNVGNAVGLLFEASTTEGWVDMMLAAVDAVGSLTALSRLSHGSLTAL